MSNLVKLTVNILVYLNHKRILEAWQMRGTCDTHVHRVSFPYAPCLVNLRHEEVPETIYCTILCTQSLACTTCDLHCPMCPHHNVWPGAFFCFVLIKLAPKIKLTLRISLWISSFLQNFKALSILTFELRWSMKK